MGRNSGAGIAILAALALSPSLFAQDVSTYRVRITERDGAARVSIHSDGPAPSTLVVPDPLAKGGSAYRVRIVDRGAGDVSFTVTPDTDDRDLPPAVAVFIVETRAGETVWTPVQGTMAAGRRVASVNLVESAPGSAGGTATRGALVPVPVTGRGWQGTVSTVVASPSAEGIPLPLANGILGLFHPTGGSSLSTNASANHYTFLNDDLQDTQGFGVQLLQRLHSTPSSSVSLYGGWQWIGTTQTRGLVPVDCPPPPPAPPPPIGGDPEAVLPGGGGGPADILDAGPCTAMRTERVSLYVFELGLCFEATIASWLVVGVEAGVGMMTGDIRGSGQPVETSACYVGVQILPGVSLTTGTVFVFTQARTRELGRDVGTIQGITAGVTIRY